MDEFKRTFIKDNGDVINENMFKRRIIGLTSYVKDMNHLMPDYNPENDLVIEKLEFSDTQFALYETIRQDERKVERRQAQKNKQKLYEETSSTYRIFSRSFCNFVFPAELKRPMPKDIDDIESIDEEDIDNIVSDEYPDDSDNISESKKKSAEKYQEKVNSALQFLSDNKSKYLVSPELETLSPKFSKILENVTNSDGLNLIYSQFRMLEGIGILKLVLLANGFQEFKITKNKKKWNLQTPLSDKPMFVLYTGTETAEEKEIIRNIYNSNWNNIPKELIDKIKAKNENNFRGEIIKVFMITAAGSEGINLKNVRNVHIVEPYWNPVRLDQVIGRAKRICSHKNLNEDEQNIKVFIYMMTLSKKQLEDDASKELRLKDKSKIDKKTPLTSDEALYEISKIKENINKQLLNSMKEAAIDCTTFGGENCFSISNPKNGKFSYKPKYSEEESDTTKQLNVEKIKWKAVMLKKGNKKYALRKETGDVYDIKSYLAAIKGNGDPLLVGKLIGKKIEFIHQ